MRGWGSKPGWTFSKKSSVLVASPVPELEVLSVLSVHSNPLAYHVMGLLPVHMMLAISMLMMTKKLSCSCLGYRGAQQDQIAKGGETVEPIQPAIVMISLSINLFVMINILLMRTTLTITLSQMIIIFIIVSGSQHIHPRWLQLD